VITKIITLMNITTLSKDELYDCVQLIKHLPELLGINCTQLCYYLKKSQNKKHNAYDILNIQKILKIPPYLTISLKIFTWLLNEVILKYEANNWKPYLQLYTDRGGKFCYHNLIYKNNNCLSDLDDYNNYILDHINHSSHHDGYCICEKFDDNCKAFDLIEGLVSDTRQISLDCALSSSSSSIDEYLDNCESHIDDLISWKIPFRDGIQYTHYPISWLLDNFETLFRGNVDDIKLNGIINKTKSEMEKSKMT
jgi:hypothetical protein